MTPDLEAKILSCPSLPSPTPLAVQIITLANEPDIDLPRFIRILNCDPALASKILRTANSPLYPYSKKIENLHQALMVLGLDATVSLALSFSLMKSLQTNRGPGLDYTLYWKRALLAGTICRILGKTCGLKEIEELYLCSLMQDLGMLVLDQVFPKLYASPELDQACHAAILSYEHRHVGANHAAVGSWLLAKWNFPDRFRLAISASDDPSRLPMHDDRAAFVYCVSLSGEMAEIFLRESPHDYLQSLQQKATGFLHLTPELFMGVLEETKCQIPETEKIFQTDLQTWADPQAILERARESLLLRSLQTLKEVQELQSNNAAMEVQVSQLKHVHRHDPLTGTLARTYLDKDLDTAFAQALLHHECLTLVFGDLDHFKVINDSYGHQAGDVVLQSAGRLLQSKVRTTDTVGRYGGEEFVIILPQTSSSTATAICERILKGFRDTTHEPSPGHHITVTISLGIATHTPEHPFADVTALLHAADEAVYYSKFHGRNRFTSYDTIGNEGRPNDNETAGSASAASDHLPRRS